MTTASARSVPDMVPRYTSYPTAPHFHSGVTGDTVAGWMSAVPDDERLSLYIHVPFCDRLCWFCACHTSHTLRYDPVAAYLEVLHAEVALVSRRLGGRGRVSAVHFGGGSPTMLKPEDLERLMLALRRGFAFDGGAAISIEIDPNDMDESKLDAVAAIGTTRASLGVQDFDPLVQKAINREQSFEDTWRVVDGLRRRGVAAVNLDLVYGLPHQTVDGVRATVDQCLTMEPDRLAIFGYAHVPWFKKHQTMIDETVLPDPAARAEQSRAAAARIMDDGGYVQIGIDHFARAGDPLALAAAQGTLRRNFQGYTEDACETLIGLGPSSIGRYREGHAQNAPAMGDYSRRVRDGLLPVVRGVAFTPEDLLRGWTIERLMCDFGFSASEARARFGAGAGAVIAEAERLSRVARDPMLVREEDRFVVTPDWRAMVRVVAASFDPYLASGNARHSIAV